MHDHHMRTLAWLADLAIINAEIDRNGLLAPLARKTRSRKLRPLWEE